MAMKKENAILSLIVAWSFCIASCRTTSTDDSALNDRFTEGQIEDCSQYRAPARRNRCELHNQDILNQRNDANKSTDAFIVVMGGWKSCQGLGARRTPEGMFLDEQFKMLKSNLENAGNSVRHVKTCFGLGTPINGTVTYVTSENREGTVATRDVTQVLKNLWGQNSKLYIIGHSYGGWLALKVATEIGTRIEWLFTLEPISGERCWQIENLPPFTGSNECRRPPDSDSVNLAMVTQNARHWTNFYLDPILDRGTVHSDAYSITGVNNIPFDVRGTPGPFTSGHHLLGFQRGTWAEICRSMMGTMQRSGSCTPYSNLTNYGKPQ
jgi:pimeloyl-ACP methyl ester carboxylesterase